MLTYPCRVVLRNLKKLTGNTEQNISYLHFTTCFCLDDADHTYDYGKYEDEIEGILSQLSNEGYIRYNYGNEYNFSLTQKGLHHHSLSFWSSVLFLAKNVGLPIVVAFITTLITLYIKGPL